MAMQGKGVCTPSGFCQRHIHSHEHCWNGSKGTQRHLYYKKSGNMSMYIIFTQEQNQQFSSLYTKREKVNWNLYTTRFCLFHLKSDAKKGKPDPWKCFCTCADLYPSYSCWYNPLLSFTFLSQISFFLMHLEQHQCHYDIQKEEKC